MPLPASWTQITVTATYTRTDGAPARGQVLFTSLQAVIVGGETIVPHPIRAVLDEAGSFSAEIPSTDDPDISPTGWAWTVHEHIDGLLRSPYSIEVPFDGGSIDLATVAPVIPAEVADLTGVWNGSQALQSTFDGGENTFDSTSRLNLESHQRATTDNPFGEVIRATLERANAKAMIAWLENYTGHAESPRTVAWAGAHGQSNDGLTWHNHWSVEVPDENGNLQTVFEIPFAPWDIANAYGLAQADRYVRAVAEFIVSQTPLTVEGPSGTFRELRFVTGERGDDTGSRWSIRANATAEGGANSGSDLEIVRRADDGSPVADAVEIRRSDGRIFVSDDVRFNRDDRGPVLQDRTTGSQYRLFVDNGVLDIEPVP